MANVAFKKGLLANLPSQYVEGTFYVTTDERAIYLDTTNNASGRIRLGDFQVYEKLSDLNAIPEGKRSETALYYISEINCLAKWNGTDFEQINPDTGATKFEVVGAGNAVTNVSYDPTSRKLTLTKGTVFATSENLSDLEEKVTKLESVGSQANVLESVKVNGDALAIDANKAVDILVATGSANGTIAVNGKDVAVKGLGSAAYTETTAYDAAGAADNALAAAKTYADGKVSAEKTRAEAAEAAALKAGQDAQADVDALETYVGTIPADSGAASVIAYIDAKNNASNSSITNLTTRVTNAEKAIDAIEADYLKAADKNQLNGLISAAKAAADAAQADVDALEKTHATDKNALEAEDRRIVGLVNSETARAQGVEEGLDERLVEVEAFFKLAEGESLDTALDTLVEIQKYLDDEGSAADQMVKDIAANTKAIEDEAKARAAADTNLQTAINGLSDIVDTKAAASDLTTLAGRVTTAEGAIDAVEGRMDTAEDAIDALEGLVGSVAVATQIANAIATEAALREQGDAKAASDAAADATSKANKALADAKAYADGLNTAMDGRMDTAEADIVVIKADIVAVENSIAAETAARTSAIAAEKKAREDAIKALDSSTAADNGFALTGITITDGKISAKTQAKFATETYVNNQIAANALSWGSF